MPTPGKSPTADAGRARHTGPHPYLRGYSVPPITIRSSPALGAWTGHETIAHERALGNCESQTTILHFRPVPTRREIHTHFIENTSIRFRRYIRTLQRLSPLLVGRLMKLLAPRDQTSVKDRPKSDCLRCPASPASKQS